MSHQYVDEQLQIYHIGADNASIAFHNDSVESLMALAWDNQATPAMTKEEEQTIATKQFPQKELTFRRRCSGVLLSGDFFLCFDITYQ
jgi:hypothetical protein